jgi:arginyl-tRNA synthetase
VAHLRSTVIGNALYQIFSFLGYNCVGINHLGDWGTQFGKLITAYQLWGSDEEIKKGAIDELLRLYVKFHDEAEKDPSLENQARAWFVKMEQGDEEALALRSWFAFIMSAAFWLRILNCVKPALRWLNAFKSHCETGCALSDYKHQRKSK